VGDIYSRRENFKGKKKITHSKEGWLEWAFSNVHPQVMCGGDIKIVSYHLSVNINNLMFTINL
jgi:hypothetical protein